MRILLITLCHTRAEIIEHGLQKCAETLGLERYEKYLVDHHYPLKYWETRHAVLSLAQKYDYNVLSPMKNMGGHGGFTWALKELGVKDEDIVLGVDPDSNPYTPGWGKAAVEVLKDPKIAYVSLLHDAIRLRPYQVEAVHGHQVGFLPHPEMINMTAWSGRFLNAVGGLKGAYALYGQVETPMWILAKDQGLRCGYLMDYHEAERALEADREYIDWKHAHLYGYPHNFDRFLKDKSPI